MKVSGALFVERRIKPLSRLPTVITVAITTRLLRIKNQKGLSSSAAIIPRQGWRIDHAHDQRSRARREPRRGNPSTRKPPVPQLL
jgi:hypothetical protein